MVLSISACCPGGLRRQIEDTHLKSGGAVEVWKWGYPVIGVGYDNVYVATCIAPGREEDGTIARSESWWSEYFCMTEEEFLALDLRLSAMSDRTRLDREDGFLAGMRGDHVDRTLVSAEFLVGHQSAVDVKAFGVLHVNHH